LQDVSQGALARARETIEKSLAKFVEKGKLRAEDRDETIKRLRTDRALDALHEADFVVEAIVEDAEAKRALFSQLDRITRGEVILSSNTSSISITLLGAATARPERVLGMHFMNPVPLMLLVELIRGQRTGPESMTLASQLCTQLGKTGVEA